MKSYHVWILSFLAGSMLMSHCKKNKEKQEEANRLKLRKSQSERFFRESNEIRERNARRRADDDRVMLGILEGAIRYQQQNQSRGNYNQPSSSQYERDEYYRRQNEKLREEERRRVLGY